MSVTSLTGNAGHLKFEPPHYKTINVAVRPAKTQISCSHEESLGP